MRGFNSLPDLKIEDFKKEKKNTQEGSENEISDEKTRPRNKSGGVAVCPQRATKLLKEIKRLRFFDTPRELEELI